MKASAFLVTAFVVAFGAMFASASNVHANACRVERQAFAKAACLELIYDQAVLRMTQDIADLLSRLQAATVPELMGLQRQYQSAQAQWQQEVAQVCALRHDGDAVLFETCKIAAVQERATQVGLSLQRAAEDFGAPIEYEVPIPEAVEILIPVPVPIPFGGEARLPLLIPINP